MIISGSCSVDNVQSAISTSKYFGYKVDSQAWKEKCGEHKHSCKTGDLNSVGPKKKYDRRLFQAEGEFFGRIYILRIWNSQKWVSWVWLVWALILLGAGIPQISQAYVINVEMTLPRF